MYLKIKKNKKQFSFFFLNTKLIAKVSFPWHTLQWVQQITKHILDTIVFSVLLSWIRLFFTYKDMIKGKYNIAFMLLLLIFVKQEREFLQIE